MRSLAFLAIAAVVGSLACGAEVAPTSENPQPAASTGTSPGGSRASGGREGSAAEGNGGNFGSANGSTDPGLAPTPAAPDWSGCGANKAASCGPTKPVASESDVLAILSGLPWQIAHDGTSTVFTASADLEASAPFDVAVGGIATDSICDVESPFPKCSSPLLRTRRFLDRADVTVQGITCNPTEDIPRWGKVACKSMHVAQGARFRLRKVREDVHPYSPTYFQIVEIERPCNEACGAGEARCSTTQVCIREGEASCLHCFGEAARTCACVEGCSTRPDGAQCGFSTSPDTVGVGTCKAGTCVD